jgi:Ca2+/Na+ antiporter
MADGMGINRRRLKPPFPVRLLVLQLAGSGEFIRRRFLGVLAEAIGTALPKLTFEVTAQCSLARESGVGVLAGAH